MSDSVVARKTATIEALALYLGFLNLFILRPPLTGDRVAERRENGVRSHRG